MLARNRGKPTPEIAIPAGVNDFAGNLGVLNLDAQGALKVSVSGAGSGGTSSNFGDPDPVAGTAAGFRDPSNNMAMAKVDSQGRLLVVPSGGASGGTSAVDEATFTPGTDSYTPNGGLFNDSATNLTSGQAGVVRATASRALHSNLRNNSGTEIGTASNPVRIDPSGTTAQPVKLQDGSGNPIAATGTSLNVNITGGGSGGGAVTIADGADVTQGALADAKVVGDNSGTVSAKLRGLNTTLTSIDGKVTAVNTGAVVVASSALPTGASTSAKQPALGTAGTASADVITVQGITSMTALKVDGSAVTQPVSAASLPLPTGAATAAKQPAIGTAGSSSADVLSVQGIASGTAMPVSLASAPLPTGAATEATLSALNTKVTAVNTGAVVVASSALPSGAATETTLGTRALEAGGNLASLVTQIGAVTASPTANTVLDRLKALLTGIVLSAGTALIGKVGIDQTTPGTTNAISLAQIGATTVDSNSGNKSAGTQRVVLATDQPNVPMTPQAIASGGATPYQLISAASTNATSVKGAAGTVYSIAAFNLNAAQRYLKLYNKASAPTVGSDTPVATYMIPGNTAGAGLTISFPVGMNFGTGIAFALTTGITVADTGAVAISEISVNLTYL